MNYSTEAGLFTFIAKWFATSSETDSILETICAIFEMYIDIFEKVSYNIITQKKENSYE